MNPKSLRIVFPTNDGLLGQDEADRDDREMDDVTSFWETEPYEGAAAAWILGGQHWGYSPV